MEVKKLPPHFHPNTADWGSARHLRDFGRKTWNRLLARLTNTDCLCKETVCNIEEMYICIISILPMALEGPGMVQALPTNIVSWERSRTEQGNVLLERAIVMLC